MKKIYGLLIIALILSVFEISAQVRPPAQNSETNSETTERDERDERDEIKAKSPDKSPDKVEIKQPDSRRKLDAIEVKYKGGLYGFSESQDGTLKFDTINERLVFFGKDGKEKFSIPYGSMIVIYPSRKKVQSGAGRVVGALPLPGAGIGGSFIKKKKNYLVIQFDDPDVQARGTINFLVDTGDLLTNAIYSIGENAEMKARGDAYIRKNEF